MRVYHRGVNSALALGLPLAFFAKWVSADGLQNLPAGIWAPVLGVFGTVTGVYQLTHAAVREPPT